MYGPTLTPADLGGLTLSQVVADAASYWPLQDDAANTLILDNGTLGNDGTLRNAGNTADVSVAGPNAANPKAIALDGTDDFIEMVGSGLGDYSFIQNTAVFTISFWIKVDNASGRYLILGNSETSSRKGVGVFFENGAGQGTQAIQCFVTKGTAGTPVVTLRTADNAITDTDWHHVVIQHNAASAGQGQIFIDGAPQSITYANAFSAVSTGDSTLSWTIGKVNPFSTTLELDGSLAGVGIWSRSLSATERIVLGA